MLDFISSDKKNKKTKDEMQSFVNQEKKLMANTKILYSYFVDVFWWTDRTDKLNII